MASYFVLAREEPTSKKDGRSLPGMPVALVQSDNPRLAGTFLCAISPPIDSKTYAAAFSAAGQHALQEQRKRRRESRYVSEKDDSLSAAQAASEVVSTGTAHPASACTAEDSPHFSALSPVKHTRFLRLPPGSLFEPLPHVVPDDREGEKTPYRTAYYIPGRSGAGKSYYVAGIARKYHKLWPKHPIFVVCKTPVGNDPAFAGLELVQIPIARILANKLDVIDSFGYSGAMVIFDDWDSFEDAERKAVLALMKDVLNLGRKQRLSTCVTSHQLSNFLETRSIISEAEFVTVFPQVTMKAHLVYLCEKRLGLDRDIVKRLEEKGRWATVHTSAPLFILSEGECEML